MNPPLVHISKNAEYATAIAKQGEIAAALARVTARLEEIEATAEGSEGQDAVKAAEAILNGERPSLTAAALRVEHMELRGQAEVLSRARVGQAAAIAAIAREASQAVSTQLRSQHQQIAQRALDALLEFERAQADEDKLIDVARRAGYEISFTEPVNSPMIGRLSQQSQSHLWYRVRDLSAYVGAAKR